MNLPLITTEEVEQISKILFSQNLKIDIRQQWGSAQKDHSAAIHAVLDPMNLKKGLWSISHTEDLGGFVVLDPSSKYQIGMDIELNARTTQEIVRRVCATSEEYMAALSNEGLWTAKEAVFKALVGPQQPQVISQLCIGGWNRLDSQFETYRLLNLQDYPFSEGYGLVLKKSFHCVSFFICRP